MIMVIENGAIDKDVIIYIETRVTQPILVYFLFRLSSSPLLGLRFKNLQYTSNKMQTPRNQNPLL